MSLMIPQMSIDYIYRLKILILGDKAVGKSTIIQTYLHGRTPKTLPPNQDISFHLKKQEYTPLNNQDRRNQNQLTNQYQSDLPTYECHLHIWDISSAFCTRETLIKFKKQKFYESTSAFIFVFKDESSFKFLKEKVFPNLPKLQIGSKQDQFLIYNMDKIGLSKKLQEQAQKYAAKEMVYMRLQALQPRNIRQIFKAVLRHAMFKIEDGVITNAVLRDRNNNIVLKDFRRQNTDFTRRYNRCC